MNAAAVDDVPMLAVTAALDLFRAPDRLVMSQASPLPEGVLFLLRIAGGDQTLVDALAAEHSLDGEKLQEACAFFVQSVLFHPDSDHFRVLGVARDADVGTLKLHYRWLQKWLHPDRDPDGWSSVYSHRVNMAWDVLKRPDRRIAYLESLPPEAHGPGTAIAISPVIIRMEAPRAPRWSGKWVSRLPALVSVFTVLLALGIWWAHRAGQDMLAEGQRRASAPVVTVPTETAPSETAPAPVPSADVAETATIAAAEPAESVDTENVVPTAAANLTGSASVPDLPAPKPAPAPEVLQATVASAADPDTGRGLATSTPIPSGPDREASIAEPVRQSSVSADTDTVVAATEQRRQAAPLPPSNLPAPMSRTEIDSPADRVVVAGSQPGNRDVVEVTAPAAPAVDAVVEAPRDATAGSDGGDSIVVALAPPVEDVAIAASSVAAPAVSVPVVPVPAPMAGPPSEQVEQGVQLIRSFSNAYRNGAIQDLVVMFKPNAKTPVGNLLDFHSRHQSVFAQSTTRSIEFLNVDWRETDAGIEAAGRYEWAMRPRGGGRVRSTGGEFRIVIVFENGRAMIAHLEQRDVG